MLKGSSYAVIVFIEECRESRPTAVVVPCWMLTRVMYI